MKYTGAWVGQVVEVAKMLSILLLHPLIGLRQRFVVDARLPELCLLQSVVDVEGHHLLFDAGLPALRLIKELL